MSCVYPGANASGLDEDTIHGRTNVTIEIRQTKRRIVYRAVVTAEGNGAAKVSKTFRTKAAAQAWEQEMQGRMGRRGIQPARAQDG
jgi:hypothetical protein